MGKRKTPEDYRKLAESRGFVWIGILPHTIVKKTRWECSKGHIWFGRFNDIQNGVGCPFCAGVTRKTEKDYHTLAQSRGFEWVGKRRPVNTKTKTRWRCPAKHVWETTYGVILMGGGCPICYGNLPKTKEDYHALAEKRGFHWIGKNLPKGNKAKTRWECSREHIWVTNYSGILRGRGCPVCSNRIPKTPEDYHSLAQKTGFRWLGPKVSNTGIKTWWECEYHHCWKIPYNSIQQKHGCPFCVNKVPKVPADYHLLAKKKGLRWLGPEISTTKIKTWWKCLHKHKWETTYDGIRNGNGCPFCSNRVPKTADDYLKLAESRGYKWLGPQVANIHAKTSWQCKKSHQWSAPYNNIKYGSNCPECAKLTQSKQMQKRWASGKMDGVFQSPTSIEIIVSDALDEMDIKHEIQYRPNGYSRIFDEFIPPCLLIEVNGNYWHGPERPEQQKRDAEKMRWAKNHGFIPIVFWEHEIEKYGAEDLIRERILPLL